MDALTTPPWRVWRSTSTFHGMHMWLAANRETGEVFTDPTWRRIIDKIIACDKRERGILDHGTFTVTVKS